MQHKDAEFKQKLQHEAIKTRADVAAKDLETAANIHRGGLSTLNEGDDDARG
jgi:hypothetical protein